MRQNHGVADSEFEIRRADGRANTFVVRFGDTEHSYVDLDDPMHLEYEYVQYIASVLECAYPAPDRLSVVHVGGAGLTLPRYIAETRPTSPQIVLEPDQQLTAAVREQLGVPRGIKIRPLDGRNGISQLPEAYSRVIIVDAFAGARVPAELSTLEFFHDVRRALKPGGTLIANVTDAAGFEYSKRFAAGIEEAFGKARVVAEPAVLKGRRFGNLLFLASKGRAATTGLARSLARCTFAARVMQPPQVSAWRGGATSFTDADAMPSPEPPWLR